MANKVLLILIDGMRPDALKALPDTRLREYYESGLHDFGAQTTFPPVTLPCHMSLFHSVDSDRHGVTTNTFVPQNHPVPGLVETLAKAGKRTAFFYTWGELRDLAPADVGWSFSWYTAHGEWDSAELEVLETATCKEYIKTYHPDFVFLYLGGTDDIGHDYGWMTDEYMKELGNAANCVMDITADLPEDYDVIITADHGGHGRNHGDLVPEDMTIPIAMIGSDFPPEARPGLNIKDIAPTITKILGVQPDKLWEGKSAL